MASSQLDLRQIAVPTFDASNRLLIEANKNLQDSLSSVGKRIATIDANTSAMNMAELNKYVQTATTPEQLMSDSFKQGYDNLITGFRNQYDPTAASKLFSTQQDLLATRAKASQDLLETQAQTNSINQKAQIDKRTDLTNQYTMHYINAQNDADRSLIQKTALEAGVAIDPKSVADIRNTNSEITARNIQAEELLKNGVANRNKTVSDTALVDANTKAQQNVNVAGNLEAAAIKNANDVGYRSSNYTYNIGRVKSKQFNETALKYQPQIQDAASKYGVDQNLILAVMGAESVGDPNAKSNTGVQGLMQVTGKTYRGVGFTGDHSKPENSIAAGTKYLAKLQEMYPNDLDKVIVAYNRGEGTVNKAVAEYGKDWMKAIDAEGSGYLPRVKDNLTYLRSGNDGSTVQYPADTRVIARPNSSGGKSSDQLNAAYNVSPRGMADAYKKEVNAINAEKITIDPKVGIGNYKSVAELKEKETSGMFTSRAMIDSIAGAVLGHNYKFDDPKAKEQYSIKGLRDINLLSEQQKAYVIETIATNIRSNNRLSTNDWKISDADLINYQRIGQQIVDQMTSASRADKERKLAAAKSNYLNSQGLRNQLASVDAMNLIK